MKMKPTNCSRRWPHRALTLVEVLGALVIMGTILAGSVMAKAHHTRQLAQARQRQIAVHLIDELVSRWWTTPQGVPINQHGIVEQNPAWIWETRVVPNAAVDNLGVRVVRVEVRPEQGENTGLPTDNQITVAVDLVLPDQGDRGPASQKRTPPAAPRLAPQ